MIEIINKTDVGRSRSQNEDSVVHVTNDLGHELLLVADGMGGHNAGEVASRIACEVIEEEFMKLVKVPDYKQFIQFVLLKANKEIYRKSLLDASCAKMGTTASLVIYDYEKAYVGHIGDSRVYYIDDNQIKQLTKDHTLVEAMVNSGSILREDIGESKYKNVLLQALGTSKKITIEIKEIRLPRYFKILLCSDGLNGKVSDELIKDIVNENGRLSERTDKLIDTANRLDGSDNVSVIIMENRR